MACTETGTYYLCAWLWAIFAADWIESYDMDVKCICGVCDHKPADWPAGCASTCTTGYHLDYVKRDFPELIA
jgi:hypothetical protein